MSRKVVKRTKIGQRLEKLRERHRNLWADEDSEEEETDDVRSQPKKRSKSCLICSILSQLSDDNCCAKHLSVLKSSSSSVILPNHVMIVPVDHDLLHHYLEEHEIHQLKVKTTSIATQTSPSARTASSITLQPSPPPDDVDATLEGLLSQIETIQTDYTPTTARQTETEVMAARLPKIPLKEGRFRLGKPTTTAADEYRPSNNALTQDTTPSSGSARVSYRTNPDGTSVQISRPQFSGSPSLHLLRRVRSLSLFLRLTELFSIFYYRILLMSLRNRCKFLFLNIDVFEKIELLITDLIPKITFCFQIVTSQLQRILEVEVGFVGSIHRRPR